MIKINITLKHFSILENGRRQELRTRRITKYIGRFKFQETNLLLLLKTLSKKIEKERQENLGKITSQEEHKSLKKLDKDSSSK